MVETVFCVRAKESSCLVGFTIDNDAIIENVKCGRPVILDRVSLSVFDGEVVPGVGPWWSGVALVVPPDMWRTIEGDGAMGVTVGFESMEFCGWRLWLVPFVDCWNVSKSLDVDVSSVGGRPISARRYSVNAAALGAIGAWRFPVYGAEVMIRHSLIRKLPTLGQLWDLREVGAIVD